MPEIVIASNRKPLKDNACSILLDEGYDARAIPPSRAPEELKAKSPKLVLVDATKDFSSSAKPLHELEQENTNPDSVAIVLVDLSSGQKINSLINSSACKYVIQNIQSPYGLASLLKHVAKKDF